MAKTITIWNNKGGVFKSSICHNLAYLSAMDGLRVLLVDLDQQASLTLLCNQNPGEASYTTYDFFTDNTTPFKPIKIYKNLDLLPADIQLSLLERFLMKFKQPAVVLREKLKCIDWLYDLIIIDNAPALTNAVINSVRASEYVIVPCETAFLSFKSLEIVEDTLDRLGHKIDGIIATRHTRTNDAKNVLDLLKKKYKVFGTVSNTTLARECLYMCMPMVLFMPNHKVTKEYEEIYKKIKKEFFL